MATLYSRGRSWYLQWREDGRQYRKSLGAVSEETARVELRRLELDLELHRSPPPTGAPFWHFAEEYIQWRAREFPDSQERIEQIIRGHLIPFWGDRNLARLEPREADRFKHERLASGAAPATVAKELRTLGAVLACAVRWGRIASNPLRHIELPRDVRSRPIRWITGGELDDLYAAAGPRADWWRLLANTGMRRGEAMNLKWSAVHESAIRVVSEPGARTKSGRWRTVPLSPGAQRAISGLRAASQDNGRADARVLPRMAPRSITRAFRRDSEAAGVRGATLHDLRHTFCSHLVAAGVPLRTVQVLAGHASMSTTERYAHLAPDHLAGAVSGLDL